MSYLNYKDCIEDGDEVILYLSFDNLLPLKVCRKEITQMKYGAIRHWEIIGKKYGSKMRTSNGKNWFCILHPTPELWTLALPHRTQILYMPDISLITMQLDLKPGSLVCEAGTGSGSLSHSIARSIAPSGHLYTFEFHTQRAQVAAEEFKLHGLDKVVTSSCRDVIKDGFDVPVKVDALFLDLPSPWSVIPHAKNVMKHSGSRICSFSPCIEQVQRTCEELNKLGFTDITTLECITRSYDVKTISLLNMSLPQLNDKKETFGKGSDFNGETEGKKDGENNDKGVKREHEGDELVVKRRKEDAGIKTVENDIPEDKLSENSIKDSNLVKNVSEDKTDNPCSSNVTNDSKRENKLDSKGQDIGSKKNNSYLCSIPKVDDNGHTGYLTFASLFVHVTDLNKTSTSN